MSSVFGINVDEKSLCMDHNGRIVGVIHVLSEFGSFPDAQWSDFAAIILEWWVSSVNDITKDIDGYLTGLRFMDGPFSLEIVGAGFSLREVRLLKSGGILKIINDLPVKVLVSSIEKAAELIIRYCKENNIVSDDVVSLSRSLSSVSYRDRSLN